MGYDPAHHHRRSIRIRGYDYADAGWFFITVCTYEREPFLSLIEDNAVNLTAFGHLTELCWQAIPRHFPGVDCDAFVIMPNHVHGIIEIGIGEDAVHRTPTAEGFGKPVVASLSTIMRSFKSAASRDINDVRGTPGTPVWQRGFYERVIRNQQEFEKFRRYIESNPSRWSEDAEYRANW